MGDVVTTRAMEAFLINPTEMSDQYAESQSLTLDPQRRSGQLASNTAKKTLRLSKESFSDPLVEQLYWSCYDSDEEALSSGDSDTESINSASSGEILEMTPTRLSIVTPVELTQSCHAVEQTVYCAQAVTMKFVNHGDAVLSPKLVEIPPSPRFTRTQRTKSMGYYNPPTSKLSKLDKSEAIRQQRSVSSTPRSSLETSSDASTPSTPATSIDERSPVSSSKKVIRRKSAVFGMRTAANRPFSTDSHPMPDVQTLREFLASDPSLRETPLAHIPSHMAAPSKRKLRKFSSSFSLGRFNPSFTKRNSSAETSADEAPALPPSRPQTSRAPEVYRPTRCSSLQPPPSSKMVARGANERAPPLVLPPCPDDSEADGDHLGPLRGQTQRAPQSYSPTGAPKTGRKLHRRQRSLSADDIMMAV